MRSCPDERRRYPAGSGPHRHKGQTQAPGSWPSPSRHTRLQPRGSRREGPRCAVHHPHALPWPGNDSLVAPDRGDAGTGGSGRMLEQGYLATLCYLSPKTVTPHGSLRWRLSRSTHAPHMGQCCHALPTIEGCRPFFTPEPHTVQANLTGLYCTLLAGTAALNMVSCHRDGGLIRVSRHVHP